MMEASATDKTDDARALSSAALTNDVAEAGAVAGALLSWPAVAVVQKDEEEGTRKHSVQQTSS